jgi:UDP-GlcNAc:undecaprenyl-phosphate GlcNAc-1-phosphate transferase
MGDAGSLFLGMTLAVLGLELTAGGVSWLAVLLLFAVPLFDTTLVTVSRLRRGKNPMTHPGTDHLAHRLARRGLGVRGAVTALYMLGALGAALAWAVS